MDTYTASEEAFKNGFERGYAEGLGDRAAELLDGAVRWHRRFPDRWTPHCFIVVREPDGVNMVYLGSYSSLDGGFSALDYGYIARENVVMWGEYRPVVFSSPGID